MKKNETYDIPQGQLFFTPDLEIKEYTPESPNTYQEKSSNSEIQTLFNDLLIRFDEMGFEPTTYCSKSEAEIQDFKVKIIQLKKKVYELEIRYADIQFQNSIYEKICKSK
ncbi:MAG: hypothetical protein IJR66_02230 [Clostridia bacterium]|nr:hypothetical protein [Clostridia bacterium]MBQ9513786.1 hypothetical protein [Clostridia bacterium]